MARRSNAAGAALSADAIVTLAVQLADEAGLERVSMRRLASELSVTPMALYWHFEDKDALIQAMAERAVSDIVVEDSSAAIWQDRLRSVLTSTLTVLIAHPWLGHLRRRVIPTPNYLRVIETLLEVMRVAGYDDRRAVTAVDTALDGVALLAGRIGGAPVLPTPEATSGPSPLEQLRELGSAGYPRIADAADALSRGDDPRAGDLVIEILVRGIEAAVPDPTAVSGLSRPGPDAGSRRAATRPTDDDGRSGRRIAAARGARDCPPRHPD